MKASLEREGVAVLREVRIKILYLKMKEIRETATTRRSSKLNPDLQKAPGCRMKP